jgi:peptidyl-tRNA hydrolase
LFTNKSLIISKKYFKVRIYFVENQKHLFFFEMKKYQNRSGNSNVKYYQISQDSIIIIFNCSRERYTYSYRSAGSHHVEKMKKLAINGIGLNSYILTIVKYDFEKY